MANPRVSIKVDLDAKAAESGFARLRDQAKTSFAEINSALEVAGKAFDAVAGAIGKVASVAAEWTKKAAESEAAQKRLALVAGSHLGALQKLNAEMLKKLGIDDDDSAALQTKLVALGVLPKDLERATKATVGLADATGKGLLAATKEVAKAFRKGGDEAKRLESLFGVAEASSQTFEGATKRLNANWGEFEETLGGAITQSDGLKGAMDAASEALAAFTDIFQSDDGRKAIDGFFRMLVGWTASAINAFLGARRAVLELKGALRPNNANVVVEGEAGSESLDVAPQDPVWIKALQDLADKGTGISTSEGGGFVGPPRPGVGPRGGGSGGGSKKKGKKKPAASDFNLEAVAEFHKHEKEVQDALREHQKEADAALLKQEKETNEVRFQGELDAFEKRRNLKEHELSVQKKFQNQLAMQAIEGTTQFVSGTIAGLISGQETLEQAARAFFGGLLSQLGQALVAMGTSAIAAGVLGTAAPIFAGMTGGPAGIAAGAALVAAGGALIGFGGLVSAGGSKAAASSSGGGASAPRAPSVGFTRFDTAEPRGFQSGRSSDAQPIVFNIDFNGPIGGSPRRIARDLQDLLVQGRTLRTA